MCLLFWLFWEGVCGMGANWFVCTGTPKSKHQDHGCELLKKPTTSHFPRSLASALNTLKSHNKGLSICGGLGTCLIHSIDYQPAVLLFGSLGWLLRVENCFIWYLAIILSFLSCRGCFHRSICLYRCVMLISNGAVPS